MNDQMSDYEDSDDDVSVSPLNEAAERRDTRFQPGQSGNPAGRPKGTGKAKSRMRTTLKELYSMQEASLDIIRLSITGRDKEGNKLPKPSKEDVDLAKYVIKTIESYNNSCLREEGQIISIRDKGNADGAAELESNQSQPAHVSGAFSLEMPDDADRGK